MSAHFAGCPTKFLPFQRRVNPHHPKIVPRFRRFFTRRRIATWSLLPIALLLMGCLFSPDRLILFPSKEDVGSIGATRRTLPFRDGLLEIWTARNREQPLRPADAPVPRTPVDAYILRFYGNADRADPNVGPEAREWTLGSVEFRGMNYPGYGGSTGPARLENIGPAALATFDALRAEAAGKPIIVYGTSLGTTAALSIAAHRPVAGVILQNPPPIKQIIRRQFGWWNLWLIAEPLAARIPSSLDSLTNARATHAPGVFLLAEEDTVVKPKYQQLVVNAYAGPKQVITQPGADHNEPLDGPTTTKFNAAVTWMLQRRSRHD